MPSALRALFLPLLAALAACASTGQRPAPPAATVAETRAPITLLVSIDGFRPAVLHHGRTPNLDALADSGVSGTMRPSFPSITFPNHIALVTGLTPDHHGIVDNAMRDPQRPGITWKISDPAVNRDPFWWDTTEPIWVSAERAGIRTAVMFWPGSDAAIHGVRPSSWFPYDAAITSAQRVDTVLDWARRPAAAERPAFITLYFDVVDKASHTQGYDSPEERDAISQVDTQIGRLRAGLSAMDQPVNLVVVSDHGMAPVPADHVRPITDIVDPAIMESITQGPWLDIYPKPGQETATARALLARHDNIDCWRKQDIPARYGYGHNPRVAPFVCMAHLGWSFVEKPRAYVKGEHGYDPDEPSMRALFIASGPAFDTAFHPPEGFANVDVYPLLTRLIGIATPAVDGNPATLDGLIAGK
ncbi:ectonucleotide pyrophosphatase/phosphodiesterase [Sphingobium aquiterrae]|uniref:alkaline phosphatase family protein n=1 Tax=Sphingobium aquiterrae TaxID=2038656 RepID=UPI003016661A